VPFLIYWILDVSDDISFAAGDRRGQVTEDGMLVLSRKTEQTIMIGDDIEIKVVQIRGDQVKLGITAPRNVSVHRREVYDSIRRGAGHMAQKTEPHAA
jgi:carbon storage regulator